MTGSESFIKNQQNRVLQQAYQHYANRQQNEPVERNWPIAATSAASVPGRATLIPRDYPKTKRDRTHAMEEELT
jgi:hypothetical protein